jgi:hypothetical protein
MSNMIKNEAQSFYLNNKMNTIQHQKSGGSKSMQRNTTSKHLNYDSVNQNSPQILNVTGGSKSF